MRSSLSVIPIRCLSDTKICKYTLTHAHRHTKSKCRTKRNGVEDKTTTGPQLSQPPTFPGPLSAPHSELPQAACTAENWGAIRQHLLTLLLLPLCQTPKRTALLTPSGRPTILQARASKWLCLFKFSRSWLTLHMQHPFTKTPQAAIAMRAFQPELSPSVLLSFWLPSPFLWTPILSTPWKVIVFSSPCTLSPQRVLL